VEGHRGAGLIAPADCTEVRVTLTEAERTAYAVAEPDERYRLCSTARTKLPVARRLAQRHAEHGRNLDGHRCLGRATR